ncbi:hypothetical protein [Streptomyces sp. NBC_01233]|uniref:hypothetical protein n=1 Tax=Streptomyces sp. NBC_01233 TaxID=2903787 RepID=UPI002E11E02A|nr:hypothetical protein OG332_38455 [Streptomyces sp. NBC_01233]
MYDLLRASLPEFLGSLGAALFLALCGWVVSLFRHRTAGPPPATPAGVQEVDRSETGVLSEE